jgi:hypothetical protein
MVLRCAEVLGINFLEVVILDVTRPGLDCKNKFGKSVISIFF